MTTIIRSGWVAQAAPSFAPFAGANQHQVQSWTNGLGNGAMVTGDGNYLVIWTTTQMQYFDPATGAWSSVVAMPAGARPVQFAPIYGRRSMFYDSGNSKVWGVDFAAGTTTDCGYVNTFKMQLLPSTGSWRVSNGPPAIFDPAMPGYMAFPVIDLFSKTALLLYDYTGPKPRLAGAMEVSDSNLGVYGVGNGSYAEQNPGAGDNGAILPGRYMHRPGIGQTPLPGGNYGKASSWWPPSYRWPGSVPVPYFQFGAAAPYTWQAARQIDNSASSFFNTAPTPFEATLQGVLFQQSYSGTDGRGMVQATLAGNSLASVLYAGFDLAGQGFRVPISVAAPSPLNASSWMAMAMAGTAYVIDRTPLLYALALVQYDEALMPTENWTRSPTQ